METRDEQACSGEADSPSAKAVAPQKRNTSRRLVFFAVWPRSPLFPQALGLHSIVRQPRPPPRRRVRRSKKWR